MVDDLRDSGKGPERQSTQAARDAFDQAAATVFRVEITAADQRTSEQILAVQHAKNTLVNLNPADMGDRLVMHVQEEIRKCNYLLAEI